METSKEEQRWKFVDRSEGPPKKDRYENARPPPHFVCFGRHRSPMNKDQTEVRLDA